MTDAKKRTDTKNITFEEKFEATKPFNVFYNIIPDIEETTTQVNAIQFSELLDPSYGELTDSFHITNNFDPVWFSKQFIKGKDWHMKPIVILYGSVIDDHQLSSTTLFEYARIPYEKNKSRDQEKDIIRTFFPKSDIFYLDFAKRGFSSAKLSIFRFRQINGDVRFRILISTANLCAKEWIYYSHTMWVSPLLRQYSYKYYRFKLRKCKNLGKMFRYRLSDFIKSYANIIDPELRKIPEPDLKDNLNSDLKENPESDSQKHPQANLEENPESDLKKDPESHLEENSESDSEENPESRPESISGESLGSYSGEKPEYNELIDFWSKRVMMLNCNCIKVTLLLTIPHTYQPTYEYCHRYLSEVLKEKCQLPEDEDHITWSIIAQGSGMCEYDLGKSWLYSMREVFNSHKCPNTSCSKRAIIRPIFPTFNNITDGNGSWLPIDCEVYKWQQPYFQTKIKFRNKWIADSKDRSKTMCLSGIYCRISPNNEHIAWFLISSANFTRTGWGYCFSKNKIPKYKKRLFCPLFPDRTENQNPYDYIRCNAYQLGVLFLPINFKIKSFVFKTTDVPILFDIPLHEWDHNDKVDCTEGYFCEPGKRRQKRRKKLNHNLAGRKKMEQQQSERQQNLRLQREQNNSQKNLQAQAQWQQETQIQGQDCKTSAESQDVPLQQEIQIQGQHSQAFAQPQKVPLPQDIQMQRQDSQAIAEVPAPQEIQLQGQDSQAFARAQEVPNIQISEEQTQNEEIPREQYFFQKNLQILAQLQQGTQIQGQDCQASAQTQDVPMQQEIQIQGQHSQNFAQPQKASLPQEIQMQLQDSQVLTEPQVIPIPQEIQMQGQDSHAFAQAQEVPSIQISEELTLSQETPREQYFFQKNLQILAQLQQGTEIQGQDCQASAQSQGVPLQPEIQIQGQHFQAFAQPQKAPLPQEIQMQMQDSQIFPEAQEVPVPQEIQMQGQDSQAFAQAQEVPSSQISEELTQSQGTPREQYFFQKNLQILAQLQQGTQIQGKDCQSSAQTQDVPLQQEIQIQGQHFQAFAQPQKASLPQETLMQWQDSQAFSETQEVPVPQEIQMQRQDSQVFAQAQEVPSIQIPEEQTQSQEIPREQYFFQKNLQILAQLQQGTQIQGQDSQAFAHAQDVSLQQEIQIQGHSQVFAQPQEVPLPQEIQQESQAFSEAQKVPVPQTIQMQGQDSQAFSQALEVPSIQILEEQTQSQEVPREQYFFQKNLQILVQLQQGTEIQGQDCQAFAHAQDVSLQQEIQIQGQHSQVFAQPEELPLQQEMQIQGQHSQAFAQPREVPLPQEMQIQVHHPQAYDQPQEVPLEQEIQIHGQDSQAFAQAQEMPSIQIPEEPTQSQETPKK